MEAECGICGHEFEEEELENGECPECREKEYYSLDEIAQENGFSSWGSSYNQ
jgi:predicted Zn-ribbon and HTH transcriptional regulator